MMSDGGHLCLDWYNETSPQQPTVLFMPGITGGEHRVYTHHTCTFFVYSPH